MALLLNMRVQNISIKRALCSENINECIFNIDSNMNIMLLQYLKKKFLQIFGIDQTERIVMSQSRKKMCILKHH